MEVHGEVSAQEIDTLVQRYCDDHFKLTRDYEVLRYSVKTISDALHGFLGKHYFLEIAIKSKYESKDNEIRLKYFVKKAPVNVESFMKYINEIQAFAKECDLFHELIPTLQRINSKFGNFAPECYMNRKTIIVLEDLAEQGYQMKSSGDQLLDHAHLLCAMKTIAKFHSASIVLENRLGKKLNEVYTALAENSFPGWDQNVARNKAVLTGLTAICALIKRIPKYQNSSEISWIVDSFRTRFLKLADFSKPSKRFRGVFLHGDLWANNLMFKYDDMNNPSNCRIVDFQFSRYGAPMLDLMTLLTAATTSEFRKDHMETLLEVYYHHLNDFLAAHDIDVDDFITKIEFKECATYFREFGSLMSCHITSETLLPSSMTAELFSNSELFQEFVFNDRVKCYTTAFEKDSVYKERMTDMITDYVDNFILNDYHEYNF